MKFITNEHYDPLSAVDRIHHGNPPLHISEIIGMIPATSMPEVFEAPQNVIRFGGKLIPLMDLRMNLGLPGAENVVEQICILAMESSETNEKFVMAVLMDSERDIYELVMGPTH